MLSEASRPTRPCVRNKPSLRNLVTGFDSLARRFGLVVEWHTRWFQKPLPHGMRVRIPPGLPGNLWYNEGMKNFFITLITFFVDLFTKSPVPVDLPSTVEVAPILEDPNAYPPEEVEAVLAELDDDNPETPEAPEIEVDAPELDDLYEDLDDDTETVLEDLPDIGGGVEFE